ncbi:MAG: hypothetical protein JW808_04575 [Victivallales bacterium]|nr:hypothetical protein [Victivallales bacterium]
MRTIIAGRNSEDLALTLSAYPFTIVEDSPELVITYGGDGTLLGAEREFPCIPKLPLRDQAETRCPAHKDLSVILDSFFKGTLQRTELMKIAGSVNGRYLSGINDVFIHNEDRGGALRYRVYIDGEPYGHEIIGDGLGISTVLGSTAYYRSITHSIFKVGIGLAFNNSTEVTSHQVLPEDTVIKVRVTRGPALLVADNSIELLRINAGDEVVLKKIPETATVFGLKEFMCQHCRRLRHAFSSQRV